MKHYDKITNLYFNELPNLPIAASTSPLSGYESKNNSQKNSLGNFNGWEPVFEKYFVKKILGSGSYGDVVHAQSRFTG